MPLVQQGYARVTGTTTVVTLAAPVTPGNTVICVVQLDDKASSLPIGGAGFTGVADTKFDNGSGANSYALDYTPALVKNPTTTGVYVYRRSNVNDGPSVFTFKNSSFRDVRAQVFEFSGLTNTSPLDVAQVTPNPGANNAAPTTSATLAVAGEDVIAWFVWSEAGTDGSFAAGSGWTRYGPGAANDSAFAEYQNFASSGAKTVDAALGANQPWDIVVVSYKPAAGGGGGGGGGGFFLGRRGA